MLASTIWRTIHQDLQVPRWGFVMQPRLMITIVSLQLLIALSAQSAPLSDSLSLKGKGELVYATQEAAHGGMRPWYDAGAGQMALRSSKLYLGPQSISVDFAPFDHWSSTINSQYHHASETGAELTEAWLTWQPLPVSGYKARVRAGWFYPNLSLENTDPVWTSPYTSNFSLINSWFAEELRANAIEFSLSRPGRAFHSDWSWQWVAALAKGNDPLGTVISWRGFALHNLQTGLHERINFADYPSLQQPPLTKQPAWVEPFRELDGKSGYYTGIHALWRDTTELRYYHYNNRADPTVFAKGQYAWHTQFDHVALQHQLTDAVRLVGQVMQGDTQMGWDAVNMDYRAWFVLLNYSAEQWQFSWRYDHARQDDKDKTPLDDNNGRAHGWTANISYQLAEHWQVSSEFATLSTVQPNRAQWPYWPVRHTEQVGSLILTWRLD